MKSMNALVAKEIRLLTPAWAAAMLLAVAPAWLLPHQPHVNGTLGMAPFLFGAFWFGMVALGLSSFGREFAMKTFPLLLALPSERRRAWRTKIAVLAGAMLTVFVAWAISSAPRITDDPNPDWPMAVVVGGLAAAALVAGGLCMTLLLRQIAAAFWFTILGPWAIAVVDGVWGIPDWLDLVFLIAYSVGAFFWARWQFFNAQEVGWTGGTIALPGWRPATTARPGLRSRRPLAMLFWKEIKLHQVGLAGMAGLFLLHLGVVAVRKYEGGSLSTMLKMGLDVFGGIWLLVPLLIGGTSVAEERKLGTMQNLLSLPVSRKTQFFIKLVTVLFIGGFLSALLLWTAEGIGSASRAYCGVGLFQTPFSPQTLWTLCWIFLGCTLICFYASTLVGGLIQSFAASALTAVALWSALAFLEWLESFVEWHVGLLLFTGELLLLISVPCLTLTLIGLAYRNFKVVSEGWRLWRSNVLAFITVLLVMGTTTSLAFNRVWEFLTPLEPVHGPARLVGPSQPRLEVFGHALLYQGISERLSVLTPDNRVWTGDLKMSFLNFDNFNYAFLKSMGIAPGGRFLSGSNWLEVVFTDWETAAIRTDGTLWVSEKPDVTWHRENGKRVYDKVGPYPLVQYGTNNDWKNVVREGWNSIFPILLKKDGTLWRWGPAPWQDDEETEKLRPWPGLRAFEPYRLGTESNWARIMTTRFRVYAWKVDGQAWAFWNGDLKHNPLGVALGPEMTMNRRPELDGLRLKSFADEGYLKAGVDEDGSLGRISDLEALEPRQRPVRLGTDRGWTTVAGVGRALVACKSDGSLWRLDFDNPTPLTRAIEREEVIDQKFIETATVSAKRLGRGNDWLAVYGDDWGGTIALAADGSLWHWSSPWLNPVDGLILRPSRKPRLLGNIFDNLPAP